MKKILFMLFLLPPVFFISCEKDDSNMKKPTDPDNAEKAVIDRFSQDAGTLFVRNADNDFPAAGEAINMDQAPFITQGLSADGTVVRYYNFDVQPVKAAPIYALFREGETSPVAGQLNIVNVIPGDAGYNDFWNVYKVTVPKSYVANTAISLKDIMDEGYTVDQTDMIVNCPIVPEGSTAMLRYGSSEDKGLTRGWYKGKVVFYFNFSEKELHIDLSGGYNPDLPVSDILVTFNINPDEAGGGPSSGFVTEMDGVQTHNVVETVPSDADYSPLWDVDVYDNADFDIVHDWMSAMNASIKGMGVALVNCPIVSMESK